MHSWAFVDTSFLIASENEEDEHYINAQEIMEEIKTHPTWIRLVFTDYIFDEYMSYLKVKNTPAATISKIGNGLLSSQVLQMYFISPNQFQAAWGKIQKFADKNWSFTDCTSFVIMEELELQFHLSYDDHFNQAGFIFWPGFEEFTEK